MFVVNYALSDLKHFIETAIILSNVSRTGPQGGEGEEVVVGRWPKTKTFNSAVDPVQKSLNVISV